MVKVSLDAEAKEVLKTWPPRTSGSNEYFGTARPANMREITTEEYEAQDKRLAAEMMGITSIWDNGGKTADRYSVVTKEPAGGGNFMILGLSDDCYSPGGVNMFGDGKPGPHLGKKIKFEDLPSRVQACVIARLKED